MTPPAPAGAGEVGGASDGGAREGQSSPTLTALAEAHGVATEYSSFASERVRVPATTLRAVLTAMGVAAADDDQAATSLAEAEARPWRRLVPGSTVVRAGAGEVELHVADGNDVEVVLVLEDGSIRPLSIPEQQPVARTVDGRTRWRVRVPIPADVPLGWHSLQARQYGADADVLDSGAVIVTPHRLLLPPADPARRAWGLMAQLYSVRSRRSWGLGDFTDLADLAAVAGEAGADYLLINPVHAAEVTTPIEPSPYLPSSRRFLAPLYIRPELIPEAAYLSDDARTQLDLLREQAAATNEDANRIDRDAVWKAKREALELVHEVELSPARRSQLAAFARREGTALADFALWCAVQEHEVEAGRRLPDGVAIDDPAVSELREELRDRIAFHVWLQWIVDVQLSDAASAARAAGMRIGIMHDLAVGVSTVGSDAWSMHDLYAPGVVVGAPPDMYNQQGQSWNQPPWLPARLAESAYAPLRDMVRTLLRHAGALRIDHILGFFRLWWIPDGLGPGEGTYVRYDHEAMIGVLALEAQRAGAVIIGEDLGLVEPWVRDYLADRGILGTSVLWFESDGDGSPLAPERYRRDVLATVNTHDLPPTAGYLKGEHVDLRSRLGLLTRSVDDERRDFERERDRMLAELRSRGLIDERATEQDIVEALHVFLAASPSRLLGVSLVDAVGERRVQNQPGTDDEYPNWQVPLADADGDVVLLDDLANSPRFRSLVGAVERSLRGS
ncbi:4-alpha-glucanotransferase [Microbacterium sp. cf332]|uniref:4-alpha-glucanotransferase n=1 Tax=Microbacterium sp. cf332 TaxID=1761804 RepID=UPI00087EA5F9|nr:4-alpha-glucanotransferase [Microbacterium sp. cf332]SDQ55256.1 4-alpha-glucanotransferase [Microbacterium sp. cf332]